MTSSILDTKNINNFYKKLENATVVKGGAFGGRKIKIGKELLTMNQIVRKFEKLSKEIITDAKYLKDQSPRADERHKAFNDSRIAGRTLVKLRALERNKAFTNQRNKLEKILAPIAKKLGNLIDTLLHLGESREKVIRKEEKKYQTQIAGARKVEKRKTKARHKPSVHAETFKKQSPMDWSKFAEAERRK